MSENFTMSKNFTAGFCRPHRAWGASADLGLRELAPLPQGYDRECLLEGIGGEAKLVAGEPAKVLTRKLSGSASLSGGMTTVAPAGDGRSCANLPTAFVTRLTGCFSTDGVQTIEEYLRAFGCCLFEPQSPRPNIGTRPALTRHRPIATCGLCSNT
jgi:hypothetical protein